MSLNGLDGYLINVQVDISSGIPCWEIVGLADTSIKESRERVKISIKNSGYEIPSKKIIINLAPADKRKEGSFLDLAIAVGILKNLNKVLNRNLDDTVFLGELSFNGKVNRIRGILPICIEAKKLGIKNIVIPKGNVGEALIVEGINIIGVETLEETVRYINKNEYEKHIKSEILNNVNYDIDFSDIIGQEAAKRALEIAASANHNCLLIGTPGTGKTMLAKRLPTILPDMTYEEKLETTKIYSVAGKLSENCSVINNRPFRNPHHTISKIALIGGGRIPKPGEISLAHNGVLFLDELTEFSKSTLEVLREPLEENSININRVNGSSNFPSNFVLIAATNPCPCGYFGSNTKKCKCSNGAIDRYLNKMSGPFLDRIDLQVEVNEVEYEKINNKKVMETSKEIKERVSRAREIQIKRYKNEKINYNSELTPDLINKYCKLDFESKKLMEKTFEKLNLSVRGYYKIIKVGRTIADLAGKENINKFHLAEAIQYRSLEQKYWRKYE